MRYAKIARLAGVAALATGLAFAQSGNNAGNQPARNERMSGRFLDRMAQRIGLTDDQKAQAKTIFENARNESQQYFPQLKTAREAFQTALKNGAGDAELQKAAENQAVLQAKLHVIHAKARRDFENLLTPEQLAKAKEMRGFGMGRFGRRGFGG